MRALAKDTSLPISDVLTYMLISVTVLYFFGRIIISMVFGI